MNKIKIALITILGSTILYFTSLMLNHKTELKNSVSENNSVSKKIVEQNNIAFTNTAPSLKSSNKKQSVLEKDEKNEKEALEEREEKEREELEGEAENEDAPELAFQQDFERTKDPALNRPTPEVLPGIMINNAVSSLSGALLGLPGSGNNTSWSQRGPNNVGGRTRALAWDPNDGTGKKVWAGGVSGGLWYNNDITDANSAWVNVGDVWSNLSITKIVFDPVTTTTIYVSTGEGYQANSSQGAGIWKSTDDGATWTQLSSTTGMTYINDLGVRSETISGTTTGVVYAAVDGNSYNGTWSIYQYTGLYRSTDGGTSWTQVLPFNLGTGLNYIPYTPSSISFGANNRIWIGTKSNPYYVVPPATLGGGNIFYSDNGTTWTNAYSTPVTFLQGRVTVAAAPSNANYIYGYIEKNTSNGISTISLIKTTDNGTTWSDLALPDDAETKMHQNNDFTRGQAWYDQVLKVDPLNASAVYVGGVDLFKSTDAGSTWTQLSKWSNNPSLNTLNIPLIHADQHTLEFKPGSSTTAMFGNDGGVFYSNNLNNAISSITINQRNKNYNVTQFYAAAIHPTTATDYYLAGAQDNGTQKFTSAGLSSTSEASGGDGAYCFIDQTNPNYQITAYTQNTIYLSTNGGANFSTILNEQSSGSFINPATYDNNLHIYYSYKSSDGTNGLIKRITGINGTPSASDVSITGLTASITAFKVSPYTTNSTTLFIGTSKSKILKVTNADGTPGVTVINTSTLPANASISCIDIGANENELLVTFFNYGIDRIWYTNDGGVNWSNKMGNGGSKFPNIPVRWAMFNPSNRTNDVLLATELGIYGTTNFSAANPSWSQMNNGFTNVRTDMLQYRPSDKQVIAATFGRGLFSSNGFNVAPTITSFTPTTATSGTSVTITGTNFTGVTAVSFGNVAAASYTATSSTSITAIVANGASGNVAVTNADGQAISPGFTYCATPAVSLSSGVNSNIQNVCQNTAINSITYTTTNVTGVTLTGAPAGVTASLNSNLVTISGTPTNTGTFNYTLTLTSGCLTTTATGTITVSLNAITLTSATGTDAQTICSNNAITDITYTTNGPTSASFSGLPAGVTGTMSGTTITISGTPTPTSGTFNYTITLSGGCSVFTQTGRIVIPSANTVTLASAAGTNSQTVCLNTVLTNIRYNTTGATGATFTGLPAGVTGTWAASVATISGTPTTTGTFSYTVTLTGGCSSVTATGTITIPQQNTIALASGSSTQTVCINSAITNITYNTTGATGATFSGLPTGVTGAWANNIATISGTPTVAGTYTYTVSSIGGCGSVTATGTITSNINTIVLSSTTGTDAQRVCSNSVITNITYATTGATGATFTGLPGGITGSWSANVVTISGTITETSGTFTYTVTLTGGCGTVTKTGSIGIQPPNTITLSSNAGTDAQTACSNVPITNITYTTTGATGATFAGLPNGVSGAWAANTITISGTPTPTNGTFTYTITLTGGCGTITKTGSIYIPPANTITLSSPAGTNSQTHCININIASITYTTTGATGATFTGLPTGVTGSWANNLVTIVGTPTVAGTFNYIVTTTGGCGGTTATGTIVSNLNTINLSSAAGTDTQIACIGAPITNITYTTTGATGASFSGLPGGVTGTWANNIITISGTPTPTSGTFNFTITLNGGCGTVTKTGSIAMMQQNSMVLSSAAGTQTQTVCSNTPIANITYAISGSTGATFAGLPAGVIGDWANNTITISGTPTPNFGTFNYTVTLLGGCLGLTQTGSIIIPATNTIALTSAAGSDAQSLCANNTIGNITYTTTGATGATFTGLPVGVTGTWSNNAITISERPTVGGTYNYTITLTGGCGVITKNGLLKVDALSSGGTASAANTDICIGTKTILSVIGSVGDIVWQQSSSGSGNWTNIAGSTGQVSISTGNLTSNTYFRVLATNGNCSAAAGNLVTVSMLPVPTAPVISYTRNTQFCSGDSIKITSNLSNNIEWYKDDILIPGQNSNIYYAKNTGNFAAVIYALGCPSNKSNVIALNKNELPISPAVNSFSACKDTKPLTLTATATTGNTLLWYGTNETLGTSATTAVVAPTNVNGVSNYYVSQISPLGCESARAKITVTINAYPAAPIISRDAANNLISSYTYGNVWYRDLALLADTSNIIKPTVQGNYTAKATVNSCQSTYSDPYYYFNSVTDVIELNKDESIKIFPNPMMHDLKVNFNLRKYQKVNIGVYSSTSGGKIIDLTDAQTGATMDVSNLTSGTYVVVITSSDNKVLYIQKVMKL